METLISGYNRKCKDSIGGVNKIWLLKYIKYRRSQIVVDGNYLISFPESFIYQFDSLENPNFNEAQQTGEGGKFYEQTISLSFNTTDFFDVEEYESLFFRILIQDKNGLYRILGLYNGMESSNITYTTGSGKGDKNGIRIDFTGREEKVSFFIENLDDAGFIDNGTDEPFFFTWQNSAPIYLQNNDLLITQNG